MLSDVGFDGRGHETRDCYARLEASPNLGRRNVTGRRIHEQDYSELKGRRRGNCG